MVIDAVGSGWNYGMKVSDKKNNQDATADFMSYMKETPAQRMEDSWLKANGLTRAQLNAMSGAEQEKIRAKMRADIQEQVKRSTEKSLQKNSVSVV